jgi:hypothetical protein
VPCGCNGSPEVCYRICRSYGCPDGRVLAGEAAGALLRASWWWCGGVVGCHAPDGVTACGCLTLSMPLPVRWQVQHGGGMVGLVVQQSGPCYSIASLQHA